MHKVDGDLDQQKKLSGRCTPLTGQLWRMDAFLAQACNKCRSVSIAGKQARWEQIGLLYSVTYGYDILHDVS